MITRNNILQIFALCIFCSASISCVTNEPPQAAPQGSLRAFLIACLQRCETYSQSLFNIANTEINYPPHTITFPGPMGVTTIITPGLSRKPNPEAIKPLGDLVQDAQNLRTILMRPNKFLDYTGTPQQHKELGDVIWEHGKPISKAVFSAALQDCKQYLLNNWYYVAGAVLVSGYLLYRMRSYWRDQEEKRRAEREQQQREAMRMIIREELNDLKRGLSRKKPNDP